MKYFAVRCNHVLEPRGLVYDEPQAPTIMNDTIFNRRAAALTKMGFSSYEQYLQSELWASIRGAVLAGGRQCMLCRRCFARQVHHQSYSLKTLMGRDPSKLVPICRRCHERLEVKPDGTKRPQSEVWRLCVSIVNNGWQQAP